MKMNDILERLRKEIPNNSSVIIATSGGPDSMVLLTLLLAVKKEKNLKLVCAHVNHKLRKESDDEAKMVKKYCEKENIIFEYMIIDKYKGNTENYAREKRYEFFDKLIKKYASPYLLTAHHSDDLTETIMMRLIRGSSLKGYAGFSEVTEKNGYKIYRPLITKTKTELLNYAKENNIPYAIDQTNESDNYTRNRIRKYILPTLKKENINVHLKFLEFSKTISETEEYFEKVLVKKIEKIYQDNKLNVEIFLTEEPLIQKKLIHNILNNIYKDKINLINDNHVNNFLSTVKNKKPNIQINLPDNKILKKAYNYVWIEENKNYEEYDYILKDKVTLPNNHTIEIIDETTDHSNFVTKLNSKEIKLPIHIRPKKDGDKLVLKGLNKQKKLKDIFIDEKIPVDKRNSWPVITDDNDEIIWLPGLKKTKFDREKQRNYDIIIRYR